MRIFGSDRISSLMQKLGMEEGVPIEHGMVTKAIERAQKQVEGQHFSVRKHLLEYDDVMNKQRENIYALRREILEGTIRLGENAEDVADTREYLMTLAEDILDAIMDTHAERKSDFEQWDLDALKQRLRVSSRLTLACSASPIAPPTRFATWSGSGFSARTTRRSRWWAARFSTGLSATSCYRS